MQKIKIQIVLFGKYFDSLCIDEQELVADIDHIFVELDVEACHFAKVKEQKLEIGEVKNSSVRLVILHEKYQYCFFKAYFFLLPVADTFRTDVDADMAIDYAHCCIDLLKRENIGVKYDLIYWLWFLLVVHSF